MPAIAIVGLGVSGLACALELTRRGVPFLAFEKEDRPGGLARSEPAGGFCFDFGPHILLGPPAELEELFSGLDGLDLAVCHGRSGIAMDAHMDCVVPAPFQQNLNHLPLPVRVRLLFDALFGKTGDGPLPRNYAEFAAARCGRRIYDLFVRGYDSKRLRFPLEQIPADFTDRIERPALRSLIGLARRVRNGEGRFLYPRSGGIEALPRAMARSLPAGSIRYGVELMEIHPKSKRLVFASGPPVNYECLVTSLPLPEILSRMGGLPDSVRQAAQNLIYTSIYVLSLGLDGPVPPWFLLRLPGSETGLYRLSFPSCYAAGSVPEGSSSVVGEIAHHPARYALSASEARREFQSGLQQLGILGNGRRILVETVRDIRYGHVLYNHATRASLRFILAYLKSHSIFTCGKYGLWKDMLIPHSMRSGMELAREIHQYSISPAQSEA